MHTLKVILTGLSLLALCLIVGHLKGGANGLVASCVVFLPLWLIGSVVNLYFGVRRAGYTVGEELPVFIVVFAVPAAIAVGICLKFR